MHWHDLHETSETYGMFMHNLAAPFAGANYIGLIDGTSGGI